MKKILVLMIILMFATTIVAVEEDIFQDEIDAFCEEIEGQQMCIYAEQFEFELPVIFTENVICYSEEKTTDPNKMGLCYTSFKFTETQKFDVNYYRLTTEEEKIEFNGMKQISETVERTYYPDEEVLSLVSPYLIDFNKCSVKTVNETYNFEEVEVYEYDCSFKDKKYDIGVAMMLDKGVIILEINTFDLFAWLLENILYIILIIIIIGFGYSIIKKPEKIIKKSKPSKKRRRRR